MKALYKFAYTITKDPLFSAVVVFSLCFLVSGLLLEMTTVTDGGEVCHDKTVGLKNLCTKLNIIFLVLAGTVPLIAGLSTYLVVRRRMN